MVPMATAVLCFALEYGWPGRWLTRRNIVLLSIPPLVILLLIMTNDLYHLVWSGFDYEGRVVPHRQPTDWIFIAYGYLLGIADLIVFVWLFVRSPQHRWPVVFMLIGLVGGRLLFILEPVQGLLPSMLIDMPPVAFEFLMYAIALFGFRIFDPIPLARQAVISQMRDGALVLDPGGRVASLNPAAQRILGGSADQLKGQPDRASCCLPARMRCSRT